MEGPDQGGVGLGWWSRPGQRWTGVVEELASAEAGVAVDGRRAPDWPWRCTSRQRPGSGRSKSGHVEAGQRRHARQQRALGRRRVGSGYGQVCGPSDDGIGDWAREDGGRVRVATRQQ
jgi:hypothetical protein